MITEFTGYYRFLSNFYPAPVQYQGMEYPSVEHAFQAAKTDNLQERAAIQKLETPGQAKKAGKSVSLRSDWESVKVSIMDALLQQKFRAGSSLARELEQTGEQELLEGNTWGDTFWGTTLSGRGQNQLGKLLMEIRSNNREEH